MAIAARRRIKDCCGLSHLVAQPSHNARCGRARLLRIDQQRRGMTPRSVCVTRLSPAELSVEMT